MSAALRLGAGSGLLGQWSGGDGGEAMAGADFRMDVFGQRCGGRRRGRKKEVGDKRERVTSQKWNQRWEMSHLLPTDGALRRGRHRALHLSQTSTTPNGTSDSAGCTLLS